MPSSWRSAAVRFYRQHQSLWFLLAGMIALSAFWTDQWAWVAFFAGVALYAAWQRVWLGVLVGASFALWFAARESDWHQYGETLDRVLGLVCILSILLLIVQQQRPADVA